MNNEQIKIENWVTKHLKTNFMYYVLCFIFLSIFSLIFYFNIDNSSLVYVMAVSFFPALVVTLLTYILLKEYFFLFFILLILIIPIFIVVVVMFILNNKTPTVGYMLYTNNLTNKCNVQVLDINSGIPWYTTKGCVLNASGESGTAKTDRQAAVKQYIKVGGSRKKWSNTCSDLKNSQITFDKGYSDLLNKDNSFSMLGDYDTKTDEYKFIKKVSIFRNTTMNTLSNFKKDVPDINIADLFDLCEVKPLVVGGVDIFKIK